MNEINETSVSKMRCIIKELLYKIFMERIYDDPKPISVIKDGCEYTLNPITRDEAYPLWELKVKSLHGEEIQIPEIMERNVFNMVHFMNEAISDRYEEERVDERIHELISSHPGNSSQEIKIFLKEVMMLFQDG